MVNLRKPDRKHKIRRDRHVGQHRTVRFRRYENLPACIPLGNTTDPSPEPLSYVDLELPYKEAKKAWDNWKSDSPWMNSLRQSQLEYNMRKARQLNEMPQYKFNTIRRNKMFNEDEVSFIEETATKDLKAVRTKIESLVSELARLGKNLSDLKVVESRLTSIIAAIEDDREDCRGSC